MTPYGSVGSIFRENLSSESLPETELFMLIGRDPTQVPQPSAEPKPAYSHPTPHARSQAIRKPSFRRKQPPPSNIDLPPALIPPRIAFPDQAQPSSQLSPKILGGWNFLKRQNGPQSSPSAPSHREPRTSMVLPKRRLSSTDESDRSDVSTPIRPVRPAQSRSSTWTDNVPTVRSLAQRSSSAEYARPISTPTTTNPSTTVSLVPLASPKVVVSLAVISKDNPRGGKFGLFVRRGSVSPGQERTGFFAGFTESTSSKKDRSKKGKQERNGSGKSNESKKDLGLIKQLSNTSSSSYSSSSINNRKRSVFSTQPAILNTNEHTQTSRTAMQWGPMAEEGRHTTLTTASPPPPPSVFTNTPPAPSSLSQLQIPLSRTISPLSNSSLPASPLSASPLPASSFPESYSSVSIRSDSASSFSDEEFPSRSPRSQRSQIDPIPRGSASTTPTPSEQEDQHRFSVQRMPIASVFRDRSSSPLRNEFLGRSPRAQDLATDVTAEFLVDSQVYAKGARRKQASVAPERTGSISPSKHPWWKPGNGRNSPSSRVDLPAPVPIRMAGQTTDLAGNTVGARRGSGTGSTGLRRRSIFGSAGSFFSLGSGGGGGVESGNGRVRRASDAPLTLGKRDCDMSLPAAVTATSTTTAKTLTQRGFEVTSREPYRPINSQTAENDDDDDDDDDSKLTNIPSTANTPAGSIVIDTATCADTDTTTITNMDADADALPTPPDSTVSTCPPRRLPSPVSCPTEVSTISAGSHLPSNLAASRFTANGQGPASIMVQSSKATKTWVPLSKRAPRPPLTPPLSSADWARYPLDRELAQPQQEGPDDFSPASSWSSEAGDENGAHGWIGVPELGRPVR